MCQTKSIRVKSNGTQLTVQREYSQTGAIMTYGSYQVAPSRDISGSLSSGKYSVQSEDGSINSHAIVGSEIGSCKILVIDDQALTRDCTQRWLATAYDSASIVAAPTVDSLANDLIASLRGKLAFCLYNLHRAKASDTKADSDLSTLKRLFAQCPIIVISDLDYQERVVQALERGVRGYIPTSSSLDVAIEATRLVAAGGTFVPASSLMMRANGDDASNPIVASGAFTQRQLAVLKCLREGKANKIIAYELSMSVSTVKVHVRNIMQKLKATNRTQVAYQTRELFAGDD